MVWYRCCSRVLAARQVGACPEEFFLFIRRSLLEVHTHVLAQQGFVLAAVAGKACALQHAAETFVSDRELVLPAMARQAYAPQHAARFLLSDREFVFAAVVWKALPHSSVQPRPS